MEQFIDIKNYEGLYQVGNFGSIKSVERYVSHSYVGKKLIRERILKEFKDSFGYIRVPLSKKGIVKTPTVHRLVALTFIPNPENKPEVNHIDGNKSNNKVENLEWVTSSENQIHAFELGLQKGKSGAENPMYGRKGVLSPSYGIKRSNPSHNAKIIVDLQTGIFYDSIKDAAFIKDITPNCLVCRLNGRNKNHTSLRYA